MIRKLHIALIISLFHLLLFGAGVKAELYVCKGKNGSTSFTNAPTSSNCSLYKSSNTMSIRAGISDVSYSPSLTSSSYGTTASLAYENFIQGAGYRFSVDPDLIKAIIRVESDFNRYAVSKVGAQGLMQLMPGTAKDLNVSDPFDPMENIYGGTQYVRDLLKMFDGDVNLALAAYNAGPTNVKKYNGIPQFPETIRYVKKVLSHYKRYKGLYSKDTRGTLSSGNLRIASSQ